MVVVWGGGVVWWWCGVGPHSMPIAVFPFTALVMDWYSQISGVLQLYYSLVKSAAYSAAQYPSVIQGGLPSQIALCYIITNFKYDLAYKGSLIRFLVLQNNVLNIPCISKSTNHIPPCITDWSTGYLVLQRQETNM